MNRAFLPHLPREAVGYIVHFLTLYEPSAHKLLLFLENVKVTIDVFKRVRF